MSAPDTDVVAEVTAWLEANWDPDLTVGAWWELLGDSGWAAPTWPAEWYGRRARTLGGGAGGAGDRPLRRAGRAGRARAHARRSHHRGARERRAAPRLSARHRDGQGRVVPAVLRARRGVRPRGVELPGRARRRRVGRERPEGVDVGRALVRLGHAPRPYRSRRAQAQGHHVVRVRHAPARRGGAAAARAHRPHDVQRGVPQRRARPRRRGDRRAQPRMGGGEHHAHVRAHRPRRRWWRRGRHRAAGQHPRRARPACRGSGRSRASG